MRIVSFPIIASIVIAGAASVYFGLSFVQGSGDEPAPLVYDAAADKAQYLKRIVQEPDGVFPIVVSDGVLVSGMRADVDKNQLVYSFVVPENAFDENVDLLLSDLFEDYNPGPSVVGGMQYSGMVASDPNAQQGQSSCDAPLRAIPQGVEVMVEFSSSVGSTIYKTESLKALLCS